VRIRCHSSPFCSFLDQPICPSAHSLSPAVGHKLAHAELLIGVTSAGDHLPLQAKGGTMVSYRSMGKPASRPDGLELQGRAGIEMGLGLPHCPHKSRGLYSWVVRNQIQVQKSRCASNQTVV
jgi:hypothetical protein